MNSVFQISYLIIFYKTVFRKLFFNFPQCSIYACFQVNFIIFAISVPQNAVKKLSNFVKSSRNQLQSGIEQLWHASF